MWNALRKEIYPMKRREMLCLVSGLVIGLLFGMVLIGSDDNLRESIFGTAGSTKKPDVEYYQVSLDNAQIWLAQEYPQNSEQVKASFDVLAKLPASVMPSTDFKAAEADIAYILPQAYGALVGEKNVDQIEVKSDDKTSVCLGVDDNPILGSTLYLYLTIPSDKAKKIAATKEWEKLKDPKANVLYWKLLACYPELDAKS
jgi:hypothetical protein